MTIALTGISSMATRLLLAELLAGWQRQSGVNVVMEAVGGVDAAQRVQAGEAFDLVVLASDAIDKLMAAGSLQPGSRRDLVQSGVAVAVKAGAALPDIGTEALLKQAVINASGVGYSTGPSGAALMKLFARWGIAGQVASRCIQAPPGVPVAALLARGEVTLGFQQLSELMFANGITVVGPMPAAVQITTTFSGAVCGVSRHGGEALRLLDFLASADTAAIKLRHGMDAA